jgi:hypothetical protein
MDEQQKKLVEGEAEEERETGRSKGVPRLPPVVALPPL